MFNHIIAATLISLVSFSAVAEGGNEGTGGGDPIAYEFAAVAGPVARYMMLNSSDPDYAQANLPEMANWVENLYASLLDDAKPSQIEVVEERPVDRHGVSKSALFNRNTGKLILHRQSWQSYAFYQQVTLVAMELLGFAGVSKDRYPIAMSIGSRADDMLITVKKSNEACIQITGEFIDLAKQLSETIASCKSTGGSSTQLQAEQRAIQVKWQDVVNHCPAGDLTMLKMVGVTKNLYAATQKQRLCTK